MDFDAVTIIASPNSELQTTHQFALAQGLERSGIKAIKTHTPHGIRTPAVACWGWRLGRKLRAARHEVLVMERGYLGDRFKWTSLGWNGLNGHAYFPNVESDPSRFQAHFEMKPWKHDGQYVLIMGQVPGDASLQGLDMRPHYQRWATQAAKTYGLPVKYRPHPKAAERGIVYPVKGAEVLDGTLEEAFAGAALAICYNSNSSVDAVIAGVPTVTMDRGSMAWDVTSHRIGEIVRPDRKEWAAKLAWKQWSMDEIAMGLPVKPLFNLRS